MDRDGGIGKRTWMAALGLLLCLGVATAHAGKGHEKGKAALSLDERQAESTYEEGMKLYNLGEYEKALEKFKQGYMQKSAPAFLFNLGQCYRKLGREDEAIQKYQAYLRSGRPEEPQRTNVESLIREMEEAKAKRVAEQAVAADKAEAEQTAALKAEARAVEEKRVAEAQARQRKEDQAREAAKKRKIAIVGGVIAGVVVAGAGVGLGLAFGLSSDAASHSGSFGSVSPKF